MVSQHSNHLIRVCMLALMVFAMSAGIALAQDEAPAAKARKIPIHAHGTVTIAAASTTCPEGDDCYSISGTLQQGKETATVSGTIITSAMPATTKNGTCYQILNTSSQDVVVDGVTLTGTVSGEGCIKTTKKGSTESLVGGAWASNMSSPVQGSGKESFKGTPTDPTSTTSPLAGSGIAHLTGSVTE